VRYYRWAFDEAIRDTREGFPRLRLVTGAVAVKNYRYLSDLGEQQRETLARAMVKRFHPRAVELTGEGLAPVEHRALAEKDATLWGMEDPPRPTGSRRARAAPLRRKIRGASQRIGKTLEESRSGERFELQVSGWTVRTVVNYSSKPSYIQFVVGGDGQVLRDGIAVLSWLGVAGQSVWDLAESGDEADTAAAMIRAATYFLDAAREILAEPS
jgi:hypothetical protein